ncbi:hypothetical protein ABT124_21670 [Streptomyces sp. NPDC001982]|uniref:hypothetical protein n=1 Tax=Streptomyces sp. NPDC001982 TaxID=3154405 RepID=UPI003319AFC4
MTGDGADSDPAVLLAGVGIAFGHRGAPAARAPAVLVVTGDRLNTVLAAFFRDVAARAGDEQAWIVSSFPGAGRQSWEPPPSTASSAPVV